MSVKTFNKDEFVNDIWNKKPEIYKIPFNLNFNNNIDELSSLALEEDANSRAIIFEKNDFSKFSYLKGPFNESDLKGLPSDKPWSLMIQDLEEYLPELNEIKKFFGFIPEVFHEDIMGVICGENGTTGPHLDWYHVFIIPIIGKKTWKIESRFTKETEFDQRIFKNEDLKILKNFEAGTEFCLSPGELLYIPPGLGHHATSLNTSLSLSFGVKGPRLNLLLDVLYTKFMEKIHEDQRVGIDLSKSEHISASSILGIPQEFQKLLGMDNIENLILEARNWEGY